MSMKPSFVALAIGATVLVSAFAIVGIPTENEPPKTTKKERAMLTWKTLNIEEKSPERADKLVLTEAEWRKRLTADQFKILRSHGTDPAFCGILHDNHQEGEYHCAGCDLPLFKSSNKYTSGSGWPSFWQPVERKNVWFRSDNSYGMQRVEVLCAKCDGHLGHVFPDGPEPTGVRFCINENCLKFVTKGK